MDAAEHDVFGIFSVRGPLRQFERIPAEIGELDHLIPLIMVAKNNQAPAELLPSHANAVVHFGIVKLSNTLWQNRLQHRQIIVAHGCRGQPGWKAESPSPVMGKVYDGHFSRGTIPMLVTF